MDSIVTVVTPPATLHLTTPDAVKADLGVETDDNSLFFTDIGAVSSAIAGYLNRELALATVSEQYRLDRGRPAINLARYPVVGITSVTEAGVLLAASSYELDPGAGQLFRLSNDSRICWAASKITVVYQAGFKLPGSDGYTAGAAGSLPADIEKAAVIACVARAQGRGRDPMVKSTVVPNVLEEQYWVGTDPGQGDSGLPIESERLLDRYRNIVAG